MTSIERDALEPGRNSPWRFLQPLDEGSALDRRLIELTRAHELQILSSIVSFSRVSLLYAQSGNGKSSLLNAGLIPKLREEGYPVFRCRPRPAWEQGDPIRAVKLGILRELGANLSIVSTA